MHRFIQIYRFFESVCMWFKQRNCWRQVNAKHNNTRYVICNLFTIDAMIYIVSVVCEFMHYMHTHTAYTFNFSNTKVNTRKHKYFFFSNKYISILVWNENWLCMRYYRRILKAFYPFTQFHKMGFHQFMCVKIQWQVTTTVAVDIHIQSHMTEIHGNDFVVAYFPFTLKVSTFFILSKLAFQFYFSSILLISAIAVVAIFQLNTYLWFLSKAKLIVNLCVNWINHIYIFVDICSVLTFPFLNVSFFRIHQS